jgi:hypothetical protein
MRDGGFAIELILAGEHICESGTQLGFDLRAKDVSPLQLAASARLTGDYSTAPRRRRPQKKRIVRYGHVKLPC